MVEQKSTKNSCNGMTPIIVKYDNSHFICVKDLIKIMNPSFIGGE
jgi:hypothetical protein